MYLIPSVRCYHSREGEGNRNLIKKEKFNQVQTAGDTLLRKTFFEKVVSEIWLSLLKKGSRKMVRVGEIFPACVRSSLRLKKNMEWRQLNFPRQVRVRACWAFAGHCQETGLLLENRKPCPSAARVGPSCGPIEWLLWMDSLYLRC